jgi:hypothetical protein
MRAWVLTQHSTFNIQHSKLLFFAAKAAKIYRIGAKTIPLLPAGEPGIGRTCLRSFEKDQGRFLTLHQQGVELPSIICVPEPGNHFRYCPNVRYLTHSRIKLVHKASMG